MFDLMVHHGNDLFILFLFPLIGLGFDVWLSKKIVIYVLILSGIFLCPILTEYKYVIPFAYQFFALLFLGSLYSFGSRKTTEKIFLKAIGAIIFSGVLFVVFAIGSSFGSFAGSQTVEKQWIVDGYKVEYIRDQGFAGGPLLKYELSKYAWIPLFIKKIETSIDKDTSQSCTIHFVRSQVDFDKCNGTIIPIVH